MSMEISFFVMAQSRWSTMPTVSVKWQKQVFNGVEIDTEQPPYVFKCQLYDLTGVPPERQKIMVKGGLLKDDGDWESLGIKEGQRLMLMGTAEEIPKAPEKGPVFVEDLPEDEQGTAALGHTAGLVNLGNTCYMNSTLQCLHSVPELRLALKEYSAAVGTGIDPSSHSLTAATRDLFGELDRSLRPVAPVRFLTVLRSKYVGFLLFHSVCSVILMRSVLLVVGSRCTWGCKSNLGETYWSALGFLFVSQALYGEPNLLYFSLQIPTVCAADKSRSVHATRC